MRRNWPPDSGCDVSGATRGGFGWAGRTDLLALSANSADGWADASLLATGTASAAGGVTAAIGAFSVWLPNAAFAVYLAIRARLGTPSAVGFLVGELFKIAAVATKAADFSDWYWKSQLGKCYYR